MSSPLSYVTQRTQKSSLADWRRRLNWRLVRFRLDVVQKGTKFKVRPRSLHVLAPFPEGAEIGAGASPDEVIRNVAPTLYGTLVGKNKVGRAEMADFWEAMGSAIDSGASEADALRLSVTSCRSARLRGTVAGLYLMVNSGVALSDAMEFFGVPTFSPMLIALTRASESAGGKKGEIFSKLAVRMQNENKLMGKFFGAMAYPVAVLCLAVAVSIVLQIKALPPMVATFKEMGATIPLMTRVFYKASMFMITYWYFLLSGLFVGLFLIFKYAGPISRTPFMQRLTLKFPYIGSIMRSMCMSRALNAYCMLKSAGATDLEIYALAGAAAGNLVYREYFAAIYKRISSGEPPEDAFMRERHAVGPEGLRVAGKLKVGAFSGDTVPLLQRAANDMQDRAETQLTILPQALELPLLAICGAIVGSIILAIFLPYPSLIIDVLNKQNQK